jgi:hypothetical protein
MGATPCDNSITIEYDCQFRVDIRDSSLATILMAFSKLLPQMLMDFIQKVLLGFGEKAMGQTRKPFCCDKCGNNKEYIWHGKETNILTVFQWERLVCLEVWDT